MISQEEKFFLKNILLIYLAVLGLSCGMWDLVSWYPDSEIGPRPPTLGAQNPSHWTTREVPRNLIFMYKAQIHSRLKKKTLPSEEGIRGWALGYASFRFPGRWLACSGVGEPAQRMVVKGKEKGLSKEVVVVGVWCCQDGTLLMPVGWGLWSRRRVLITFQRAISRRENVPEVGSEVERGILMANQKCLA